MLIHAGGTDAIILYDPTDGSTCTAAATLPATITNAVGGAVGGVPVICGGDDGAGTDSDACYQYDETSDDWVPIDPLNLPRSDAGGDLLCDDTLWIVGGSFDDTTEIVSAGGTLTDGPTIPSGTGIGLNGACVVRYSDSHVIIIGGTESDVATENSNVTIIYNFEDETWHYGPELIYPTANAACGVIKDPYSDQTLVMVAGGDPSSTQVQFVNTADLTAYEGDSLPEDMIGQALVEVSDDMVVLVGGTASGVDSDCIYTFDFENGLSACTSLGAGVGAGSTAFAIPADAIACP